MNNNANVSLSESGNEGVMREVAERIIAGEYLAVVVITLDEEMKRQFWCDGHRAGGAITCYGLAEYGKECIGDILHERVKIQDEDE